jgi:hypothetical protein
VWKNRSYYEVGVWWPNDVGYGGTHIFDTLEEAQACLEKIKRSGFRHGHIRKVTTEVIEQWERDPKAEEPVKIDGDPPKRKGRPRKGTQ